MKTWRRGGVKATFVFTNARSACLHALTYNRTKSSQAHNRLLTFLFARQIPVLHSYNIQGGWYQMSIFIGPVPQISDFASAYFILGQSFNQLAIPLIYRHCHTVFRILKLAVYFREVFYTIIIGRKNLGFYS